MEGWVCQLVEFWKGGGGWEWEMTSERPGWRSENRLGWERAGWKGAHAGAGLVIEVP